MSTSNNRSAHRTAAGVLASALALSGAVAAGSPAHAAAGFSLDRIAGDSRYSTSAAIATAFGPTSGVILASGERGRSVDALSANFLAGVQGVPVLLTERTRIPASVQAVLNGLTGSKNVTIVGGTTAVSQAVEDGLRSAGFTVTRLGGANRFATSEAIITAGRTAASPIGLVASGTNFPDALAGGPLSYKGKHPMLLTSGGSVPQATLDAMVAAGTRQVIVLGGEAAVPASVVSALTARGITVLTRLGGADRSSTSTLIADYLIGSAGFTNTTFNLASGVNEGVDALGGAALSGKENRALLITNNAGSAAPVVAFATARRATLNAVGHVFGGPAAVSNALEMAVEAAGSAGPNNQIFALTPGAEATLPLQVDESAANATRDSDNRTYSATGLTNGTTYRITLVNTESITVGQGGAVTFLSGVDAASSTGFSVNPGADIADIVSVNNGAPAFAAGDTEARSATVQPVNGAITFTIDGQAPGSVTPVIYVNGGAGGTSTTGGTSPRLEVQATAAGQRVAVTESFGVGGTTRFSAPQAPNGTIAAGSAVTGVDKTGNTLNTGTGSATVRFDYDSTDLFFVDNVSVGIDAFEAALSSGDALAGGTFTREPGGVSRFELTNSNPTAPASAAAVGTGANTRNVTVTATFPGGTENLDQVVVQRAPVVGGTVGTFATVATVAAADADATAAGVQFSYVDQNVAVGAYQYRLAGINDGDQGEFGAASTTVTTTAPSVDTTAPTVADARVLSNAGNALALDTGDTFTIAFSEAVTLSANATLRVTDTDGSVYELVRGAGTTATTFATNSAATTIGGTSYAAGTVLTVTVGSLTAGTTGSIAGLNIPATITAVAGVTDAAGNVAGATGGADLVIDNE